jgi:hypothetical protein
MSSDTSGSFSAVDVGKLQPKMPTPPTPIIPSAPMMQGQSVMNTMNEPKMEVMPKEVSRMNKIKGPTFAKNMMVMLIVLVGIGILGGGSWLVYVFFVKQPEIPVEETYTPPVEETTNTTEVPTEPVIGEVVPETTIEMLDSTTSEVIVNDTLDTDGDNLADSMETLLGTNTNNIDSDNDGLSDGDEVNIWKSNPMNPDTDGDTYLDGAEVKNGYSPIGPGKIF